jgi:prophage regulatory protein
MKNNIEQRSEAPRLIYYPEVRQLTGLSRSTVWKLEKEGKFPRRRLITTNRVAWLEGEVHDWITSRSKVGDSESQPKHNLPQHRISTPATPVAPSSEFRQTKHRPSYLRDDD